MSTPSCVSSLKNTNQELFILSLVGVMHTKFATFVHLILMFSYYFLPMLVYMLCSICWYVNGGEQTLHSDIILDFFCHCGINGSYLKLIHHIWSRVLAVSYRICPSFLFFLIKFSCKLPRLQILLIFAAISWFVVYLFYWMIFSLFICFWLISVYSTPLPITWRPAKGIMPLELVLWITVRCHYDVLYQSCV